MWTCDRDALDDPITNKTEGLTEATRLKAANQKGDLGAGASVPKPITVGELLDEYNKRHIVPQRRDTADDIKFQIGVAKRTALTRRDGLAQPFGAFQVADVTSETIERYREARCIRTTHVVKKGDKEIRRVIGGATTAKRDLAFRRAAWNWAVRTEYVTHTPFKRNGEVVVSIGDKTERTRRLVEGEAEKRLAACGKHLRAVVEAALETGCRAGRTALPAMVAGADERVR